jgi:hypothetical protein
LKDLKESLARYESSAGFCCSGVIPISLLSESELGSKGRIASPPVVIWFDIGDWTRGNSSSRITFPCDTSLESVMPCLEQACNSSSSSNDEKWKGTLDEESGLSRDKLATIWHPANYGIIDAVAQALLPETSLSFGAKMDERTRN